ncbi:MAG: sensor histidine kinase [Sphingomonadales bacterium 17-56-6]|nr:MAG: sensor histidine kinase [Sphingomonadales bacterium 28-55-16]OYZ88168.1 MAG: sensor histidine kinase [Sphingomonadales bacterium 17-56-6]
MDKSLPRNALIGHQMALLTIIGFWAFYALILSLRAALLDFPAQAVLFERRLMVALVGVFVTWLLYFGLRIADGRSLGFRVSVAFIGAIPCAMVLASANFYIFNLYDPISLFKDPSVGRTIEDLKAQLGLSIWQEIADISVTHYFFLIAWSSLYVAIGYAREVREAERKTSRFAQAAQDAELRSLRYQVNPHFLFNTLNSLSSLVLTGKPKEAEAMIQNLSNFYRTSLSSDPLEDVTLAEEVELQRLYLEIESVRYPKRLRVKIDIPEALMGQHVPALILQPLVENAIKYGVSRTTRPVEIIIDAKCEGAVLVLRVVDNGEVMEADHVGGNGIGLVNVRDRLEARYRSAARLDTKWVEGGGFVAMLTLPLSHRIAA